MYFNWREFLRDTLYRVASRDRSAARIPAGYRGRRARVSAMFLVCMVWMVGGGRLGLFVDRLLFPGFRRVSVRRPVFIVGNFRSGSTYLHRLIAGLPGFSAMATWEIYFAPSITARKFWHGVWMLDRAVGAPVKRLLLSLQERKLGEVTMHRIRLQEAEEDEGLFLYLWESMFNWFFVTRRVADNPYWRFDDQIPAWRRRAAFRFYRSCLQRHLYVHGVDEIYIAKNPSFSAKINTLLEFFPDARIIYLVRNPLSGAVSVMGWFAFAWHYFACVPDQLPYLDTVLELAREWYLRPQQRLGRLGSDQLAIVRYEDLVSAPERTIPDMMEQLGLPAPSGFREELLALPQRDPNDRSHSIELSDVGLDRDTATAFFREVMDFFGYESDPNP
jgi:omega-hydroxy-beta-dihydromenaquinone-9 sulfotransferase